MAITPCMAFAQFGIQAGFNYANVSKASDINNSSKSGFNAGIIIAPASKGWFGYRSEYIFSQQGYNYSTAVNTGNVNLDYIQTSQLASINISKYFSLLFGAQTSYLVNAGVDSSNKANDPGTGNSNNPGMGMLDSLKDLMGSYDSYNKIDYGYAIGAEVHPYKGITIGAKYNVSLSKLYKSIYSMQMPSFTIADAKNNVVQLYVGWIFSKKEKKNSNPDN